ncbi:MAG: hypothetical protein BWY79_00279 [Actinobacteria bacterium ADurb.Bin444]|nr:MAG: hypothetical protein BWY79_00279 [Actinobacteria bacterium ADurb.Bin444]
MTGDMQYKLWLLDGYEVADGYIWLVMRLEA